MVLKTLKLFDDEFFLNIDQRHLVSLDTNLTRYQALSE